ncbi:unnamed protein product [Lactuca virosa]|uniref:FBD domain-containing protein n=1 Tax=Lactuca virosa TaxID=75947 RepID=A0AAU9PIK5_9ASTR|nr:unnamed protein product [Lactuca virosa]
MWFSIVGKQAWTCVSTPFPIHDLHAFNGKIYNLHSLSRSCEITCLCELRLYPKPKLMLLDTKNIPNPHFTLSEFVSFGENLFAMNRFARHPFKIQELDFVEMKWVSHEKAGEAYAFYFSKFKREPVKETIPTPTARLFLNPSRFKFPILSFNQEWVKQGVCLEKEV